MAEPMVTVYISIGNSDDKLTQREWSEFVAAVWTAIDEAAWKTYGAWYSAPAAPWQNACWCVDLAELGAEELRAALESVAAEFQQDAISWAVATTEFLKPAKD